MIGQVWDFPTLVQSVIDDHTWIQSNSFSPGPGLFPVLVQHGIFHPWSRLDYHHVWTPGLSPCLDAWIITMSGPTLTPLHTHIVASGEQLHPHPSLGSLASHGK